MSRKSAGKTGGRRAYLNEFQRMASGEYVFTGNCYEYTGPEGTLRSLLTKLWLSAAALAACVIGQGCLPAEGMMNCIYVLLPFLAEVFAAGSVIWALWQLSLAEEPLRDYVYRAAVEPLPRRSTAALISAGLALTGECLYLALHGMNTPKATAGVLVLMTAAGALAMLLRCLTAQLPWKKQGEAKAAPAETEPKS